MYHQLFNKVLFPFYDSVIRGRGTSQYYKQYNQNQWKTEEELRSIQYQKLKKLLEYAYHNVPYYQDIWKKMGIQPGDITSIKDFETLPVLTKDIIRNNYENLIAGPYKGKTMTKTTGGSTGVPLKFEYTRESYDRRVAVMMRGYEWSGAVPGKKTAYLWGADIGEIGKKQELKNRVFNYIYRRKVLNSFYMSESNMDAYISELEKYKPEHLVAYVGPLYTLSRYILDNNVSVRSPKSIVTGAEPLFEFQRDIIEQAFGCEVYNTYGSREFMLMASECPEHSGMHINIDHLVVEVIDDSLQSSKSGDIIITDLHNYGMPFIRYQNGDTGTIADKKCKCGRGLPLLQAIKGRKLDAIRTPDGKILPGEFFPHLLKDVTGIDRFQVIQKKIDSIEIKIVKSKDFVDQELQAAKKEIESMLGQNIVIDYQYVDDIPLTAAGKHRVTISEIS